MSDVGDPGERRAWASDNERPEDARARLHRAVAEPDLSIPAFLVRKPKAVEA